MTRRGGMRWVPRALAPVLGTAATLCTVVALRTVAALALLAAPAWPAQAAQPEVASDGRIRVQLNATQQTVLSSELSAKIASLPLRDGATFRAGQTLVTFDCAMFRAQLAKAEAAAAAARQTLDVNRRLAELNSIGSLEVDQSVGRVKETEAESGMMRTVVSKCTLPAPFAGRVVKLQAEAHQFVAPGKPLLEILDTRHLEVQMIVPSKWLAWLKPGARFSVRVEELERDYSARVLRTGARIDPISQSVALIGEIDGTRAELLPGMSGWAMFKPDK